MTDTEAAGDALAASFRVHAGAMPLSVNAAHDAVFIERQAAETGQFTSQQHRLIEAALALAISMEWNRDDEIGDDERLALLCRSHQVPETRRDVRCALELQN